MEFGMKIPPLIVSFQFNPEELKRNRSNSFSSPGSGDDDCMAQTMAEVYENNDDLMKIRELQNFQKGSESITFDIRLDATDKLEKGELTAQSHGIAPQLAILELMMLPKGEGALGEPICNLLGKIPGFTFSGTGKPPVILFIWGSQRVLPVNIDSMNITEQVFDTRLNPTRATVSVSLSVIEGKNPFYLWTLANKKYAATLDVLSPHAQPAIDFLNLH